MNASPDPNAELSALDAEITYRIGRLRQRGVRNNAAETDDFSRLMRQREYRDMVVGELYEAFLLPDRHEHEWEFLQHVVEQIWSPAGVASLVVGIGTTAICGFAKKSFALLARRVKSSKVSGMRHDPYQDISVAISKIQVFFSHTAEARIDEIVRVTGLPHMQLYPILKLVGCRHHRRLKNCLWCAPGLKTESKDDKPKLTHVKPRRQIVGKHSTRSKKM